MNTEEFELRIANLLSKFENPVMRLETVVLPFQECFALFIGSRTKIKHTFYGKTIEELLNVAEDKLKGGDVQTRKKKSYYVVDDPLGFQRL